MLRQARAPAPNHANSVGADLRGHWRTDTDRSSALRTPLAGPQCFVNDTPVEYWR